MIEDNWIIVHTTNKDYLAEMISQMLEENGIVSFIINKKDSNYLFGDFEIYTLPDSVMRAKLLIDKFEH
jgi:replication initiation and membrane attachment protein DnaB